MSSGSTNLGPPQDVGALIEGLNHVLGNTCRIARTTRSFAWNITGAGGCMAIRCFNNQSDELSGSIEPLALHILGLGGPALLDYTDGVVEVNPPTVAAIPSKASMIDRLREAHRRAEASARAALDVALDDQEWPTVVHLSGRIDAHRAHARELATLF
ncbi:MAG: ferritin-like domain-containing protein [Pseudomonadota bacterium]